MVMHGHQHAPVVDDEQAYRTECERQGFRQRLRPWVRIDVAPYRGDRGNSAQFIEDREPADIPGVDDVIDAAESFDGLWPQQPVSVRNDADPHYLYSMLESLNVMVDSPEKR